MRRQQTHSLQNGVGIRGVPIPLAPFPMISNPLLEHLRTVLERIALFRTHAKTFYCEVVLSVHPCPHCGGQLTTTGISQAACLGCGAQTDPTVAFQRSACCDASPVRKRTHYACAKCGRVVPSRFLFDEMIHNSDYFADMMRESRERKRRRRQELVAILAASRSEPLTLVDDIEVNPGLATALDEFIRAGGVNDLPEFVGAEHFCIEEYRRVILARLHDGPIPFGSLPVVTNDVHLDRARRFITLIFMEHGHEVRLEQLNTDILVIPCV